MTITRFSYPLEIWGHNIRDLGIHLDIYYTYKLGDIPCNPQQAPAAMS